MPTWSAASQSVLATATLWSTGVSVGASAGLMGLIGAMIAVTVRYPSSISSAVRGLYVRWVIYILIIGFLPGLNIDNAAHLGGLAGGFGCAYLAGLPSPVNTRPEQLWRLLSYAVLLLTAYCFLKMFFWFRLTAS